MMIKNYWISGISALLLAAGISLSAASVSMAGELPNGIYVGSRSLGGLSEEKAEQVVKEYVDSLSGLEITLEVDGKSVDTTAAELGFSWGNPEIVGETVRKYTKGNLIERFLSRKRLSRENVRIPLTVSVDQEKLADFVEERCTGMLTSAKEASITRRGGEFIITSSATGRVIDLEAAKKKIDYTLEQGLGLPIAVAIPVTVSEPKVTEQALETISDVLGTYSTSYDESGETQSGNIKLGAKKLNGQVLMPAQTLSGYECMQPFTSENGYRVAGMDQTNTVAGIGQVATTLYNAALRAEIEITQRQCHSMVVSYAKPSEDAAIAGTYKDIKITNNCETPIYIEAEAENGILTVTIYGKETRASNRMITFESETLEVIAPGEPITKLDNSLAPGTKITEQAGHSGTKSRLWKIIRIDEIETERTLLHTDTYNAAQAILRVGPELPPTTEQTVTGTPAKTTAGGTVQETASAAPEETEAETEQTATEAEQTEKETTQAAAGKPAEETTKETTKAAVTESTNASSSGSGGGPTAPPKPTAPTAPPKPTPPTAPTASE